MALAVSATMIGTMTVITANAYPAAVSCSGTGLTDCQLAFREPKGSWLLVQTEADKRSTVSRKPAGFIFSQQEVRHATTPGRSARLGEQISRQALTRRFAGYEVRYTKGEDCLTCAVISGADGQFEVSFAQDGRTIIDISSHDDRSHDAQGNAVGSSLVKAIGSTSTQCDAGMDTTCASPGLKGLSYILAEDDRCPIAVKEKQPTDIPACARIAGFQIHAIDPSAQSKSGYTLLCKSKIPESSEGGLKLGKLHPLVTFKVHFTGDETRWIDPHNKSETTYDNLLLTKGDIVSYGGQVKGSTFDSSTTFDGSFKTIGKGTINWGYAKSLQAFTLTTGTQAYLCEMKPHGGK